MGKDMLTFFRGIFLFLTLYWSFFSNGMAQVVIVPDDSMGTQVNQNGNIHNIVGGTRPRGGGNLFHSFGEFGVTSDNIANFQNDSGLPTSNILSRVTGGNPSNILGTIQTEGFGNANLFLMNPAGIMFGQNATINVSGATHFTTADYLQLSDGVQFAALPSPQDSLLSVASIAAFGFLESNSASLMVDRSTLSVGKEEVLSLVGGDIEISGGSLQSPDGHINLVSVTSPGTVLLGEGANIKVNASQLGQTELTSGALLNVDGESGGTIVVRSGSLMVEGSQISANAAGSSTAVMAGSSKYGIDIEVSKDVVLDNESKVSADVNGSRNGRHIRVMAGENLEIRNSVLRTATFLDGNAGNLEVHADNVLFDMDRSGQGRDIFGISSLTLGDGNSGNIQLQANNLQMLGGQLTTVTDRATGQAGNINVMIENDISVIGRGTNQGGGFIGANALFGSGNAGDILIQADNFTMRGPANLQAVTAIGEGNAGNITIILRGTFDLRETASIDNFTFRGGAAGNISIIAKDIFLTGVPNPVFPTGQTSIGASSTEGGPGGDINIVADDRLEVDKGILVTRTTGSGVGGNIIASAGNLTFTNGTSVTAESISVASDAGNAGNIDLKANGTIFIDDSTVTTQADNAVGGNIKLDAGKFIQLTDTQVTSRVQEGSGEAGSINIDPEFIVAQNSRVDTSADVGDGGDVTFVASSAILFDSLSTIDATSRFGGDGIVDIQAPIQNLSGTIAPLPEEAVPVSTLYSARCAAGQGGHFSTFVDSRTDSLSPRPSVFLASPLPKSLVKSVADVGDKHTPLILTASLSPLVFGESGEPTVCP